MSIVRDKIILSFDAHLEREMMMRLISLGYLWINYSVRNHASANAVWAQLGAEKGMLLTIGSQYREPTAQALEDWTIAAMEHFPHARLVDILGFADESLCDATMAELGFCVTTTGTSGARSYARAAEMP